MYVSAEHRKRVVCTGMLNGAKGRMQSIKDTLLGSSMHDLHFANNVKRSCHIHACKLCRIHADCVMYRIERGAAVAARSILNRCSVAAAPRTKVCIFVCCCYAKSNKGRTVYPANTTPADVRQKEGREVCLQLLDRNPEESNL